MFDRCAIAKEIAEDIEQQKCSTDSKECAVATEIGNVIINRECSPPKEPWEMTKDEFLEYHRTGVISKEAYEERTVKDFEWLGQKKKYPKLIRTYKIKNHENIEFRQTTEKLKYVKTDEEGEIVRDDKGLAVYLTDAEMQEKKLPFYDTTVVAFNEKGHPVGYASNEFGADGVWIAKEYQKRGVGTELLTELRKQFSPMRQIGQMTHVGEKGTLAYYRRQIEEALKEGKPVPELVLREYPEL